MHGSKYLKMKRLFLILPCFMACKKASNPSPSSKAQITYEVKTTNLASWAGTYLDATDAATNLSQTTASWTTTFTNTAPVPRYVQIEVFPETASNASNPVSVICTVSVNGAVVKSDTVSGYLGQIITPLAQYNLLN
jgi:hypothetical protein